MRITLLIPLLLILFSCQVKAQTAIIDSLTMELATAKSDTNHVFILGDLAFYLFNLDPEKSLKYSTEAIALSKKIGFRRGVMTNTYKMAIGYYGMGDYEKAIEKGEEALKLAREINFLTGELGVLNILGVIHRSQGNKKEGLGYLFKLAKLSLENDMKVDAAYSYSNIGTIYLDNSDEENAKRYFQKAFDLFLETEDYRNLTESYINLATVETDTIKKLQLLNRAITLGDSIDYQNALGYGYNNLGSYHWKWQNLPSKALKFFKKALKYAEQTNDHFQIAAVENNLAELFLALHQLDSAWVHAEKSLAIARELDLKTELQSALQVHAEIAFKRNNFSQAYISLNESLELADSLYSQTNAQELATANAKYEQLENQAKIARQKLKIAQQTNTRNRILIGSGLIFLLAILLFQRFYYHQKRKKQEADIALITEQKEAEKLRELDKIKSSFFTNINHELRTPLTLISSPLQEALQEVKPSPLKNHLLLAHSNTQKLLGLINEILDLSKLEAGKITLKTREVHLLKLLRRLFYAFESAAQVQGVQLIFNATIPENLTVLLDADKFEKILNNLLANALKFTEKGGAITLNANQRAEQFQFEVCDTGFGISEADLLKIFDRFYQSTNENIPLQGGTGIGLAIAKELTNLQNGTLTVTSTEGVGSQFLLTLPLVVINPSQFGIDQSKEDKIILDPTFEVAKMIYPPILLEGKKPRILIIEDNQEMSDYLAQILARDYHCTQVYDGLAGLEIIKNQIFDLITCDVMMPNLDGFSLREKMIENEVWHQIPFIMLTALALEEDKLKGLRLGVDDYLTKPFNTNELKARVHNLLTNKMTRDTYQEENSAAIEQPLTHNEQLLKIAENFVLEKIDDPILRVDDLAKKLHLSPRQLSRVMSKLIGITPVNFILEIRLQKAQQLLESRQYLTVSEVRYEIGIESASYFTKKFTERFGKNPKAYL